MKQVLLRSGLGGWLLGLRDRVSLLRTAWRSPEAVGTVANDVLSTYLITRLCAPGKVFIDIGSHIGSILAEVQRHCPQARVIGVEAMPDKAENLRRSFPGVEIFQCALGNATEEVSFYVNELASGYSSLARPEGTSARIREIKVPLRRLDELRDFTDVDAIKIDVEGAELGVVLGGQRTLGANKPVIMFESGPGDDAVKKALWTAFSDMGYGIHMPNRLAHRDEPLSLSTFMDSHVYPRFSTNYFAVPRERRAEMRDRARRVLGMPADRD